LAFIGSYGNYHVFVVIVVGHAAAAACGDNGAMDDEITRRADAVAAAIAHDSGSYFENAGRFEEDLQALVAAIARLDARYAFDRDGRPDAIAAIRHALPAVERELLEAVVDDHACELAATSEALYQVALAVRRAAPSSSPPAAARAGRPAT
jgi:hypothetical protein